jgi:hypothetical protein
MLHQIYFTLCSKIKTNLEYFFFYFLSKIYKIIILKKLKSNLKKFIYVYDLKTSPISIGDVFVSIVIIKIIYLFKKKVEIIVINDTIRADVEKRYKKNYIKQFETELFEKLVKIITTESTRFSIMSWNRFSSLKDEYKKNILFYYFVNKRKPIYKISHNVANLIFPYLSNNNKKKFYLNFDKKFTYLEKKLPEKYISLGIRYDYDWEKNRNISIEKIDEIINYLSKRFKSHKIVITCDKKAYKKISKIITNDNILYSKKFTSNFLEDGQIILNSKFYFQYGGTGISQFAEHSKVPFEIIIDNFELGKIVRSDFLFYNNLKKNSWQLKNQKYFSIFQYKIF